MTDAIPPWLVTARVLKGTLETPGSADNPVIMQWPKDIARKFPEMSEYTKEYVHDSVAWCGLFTAFCVSANGIRPPFGQSDTDRFLWANAWSRWGTKIDTPKLGCVMVFTRNGGGHVAFYEGEEGDHYLITGGNQSDSVSTTRMSKSQFTAAVWPPDVNISVATQAPAVNTSVDRFEECLAFTLRWEGGNDDDPADPGGRTSRGILQTEWDEWRQSHPGLPHDVWDAPQDQIVAVYRQEYWDRHLCGQMPAGVDLAVFDCRVLSGNGIKVVQRELGVDDDGEVGPITLAALAATPANQLIDRICDARMTYLRGLAGWARYGRGWGNRVDDLRVKAPAMILEEHIVPKADPSPLPQTVPQAPTTNSVLADLVNQLGPIIVNQVKAELQKPETQKAVKGIVATVLPKLLAGLGVSVPGVGIVMMVAGYVLPLLMPHLVGADAGTATLVSGLGLTGIPVVSKILGVLDRFKGKDA